MDPFPAFLVGIFLGSVIGFLAAALCVVAGSADRRAEVEVIGFGHEAQIVEWERFVSGGKS